MMISAVEVVKLWRTERAGLIELELIALDALLPHPHWRTPFFGKIAMSAFEGTPLASPRATVELSLSQSPESPQRSEYSRLRDTRPAKQEPAKQARCA
jgi:hypothetical protein